MSIFLVAAPAAAAEPGVELAALTLPLSQVQAATPALPVPRDPAPRLGGSRGGPVLPVRAIVPEDDPAPGPGQRFGALGLPCEASLTATRSAGATVRLRLEMPCRPWTEVTLSHGPLRASYLASSAGIVEAVFPAFADEARYLAEAAGQEPLAATVQVPGASGFERVATMSEGTWALAVHAYEFGSRAGEAEHVWSGAPRAPSVADAGRGGYLLRLGDPRLPAGVKAEVYSFPAVEASRAGTVRVALAVAPDAAPCGKELTAVTLQVGRDLPGEPVDLTLRMPDCGATGEATVLKNLARDMKIAGR